MKKFIRKICFSLTFTFVLLSACFMVFSDSTCYAINQQEVISQNLIKAISRGDVTEAKKWLDYGGDINYYYDDWSTNAISAACGSGSKEMVYFCIRNGANVNARKNYYPNYGAIKNGTELMWLCLNQSSLSFAKILLANGADVNAVDDNGDTVLEHVIHSGNFLNDEGLLFAQTLVAQGIHPNRMNNKGFTPLMLVAGYSYLSDAVIEKGIYLAHFLIQHGANPDATVAINGKTYKAIDFALIRNNLKMFEFLKNADKVKRVEVFKDKPTNMSPSIKGHGFNEIPMSEINIGWIAPKQTLAHVEEVYGKPDKIIDSDKKKIYLYKSGLFIVIGDMVGADKEYYVTSVVCYQDVQKTPSGFKVGMPFKSVIEKYGKVPGYPVKPKTTLLYDVLNLKGCMEYTYINNKAGLKFIVDKNQIIKGIAFISLLGN